MTGFRFKYNTRQGLKFILLVQLLIAAGLILASVSIFNSDLPRKTHQFPTGPISPGDQRREYRTDRPDPELVQPKHPNNPLIPNNPSIPDDFPERLEFIERHIDDIGSVLLLNGQIEDGDDQRFETHLSSMSNQPDLIALHSPGGLVMTGLSIGRIIRKGGLSTGVLAENICMSTCPYIFAAGTTRTASRQAAIGMHQHYYEQPRYMPVYFAVEDIQKGQGETLQYLFDMEIDASLMLYSLNTPPEEIYILVEQELVDTRLATIITD